MAEEEKRWKKAFRIFSGALLIFYMIFNFSLLASIVFMFSLLFLIIYLLFWLFQVQARMSDVISFVLELVFETFTFTSITWAVLFVSSFFLFFGAVKLMQLRNRTFTVTIILVNLVGVILFTVFFLSEAGFLDASFTSEVLLTFILLNVPLVLALASAFLSWDSFISSDEVEQERRKRKDLVYNLKKNREKERSYPEKFG